MSKNVIERARDGLNDEDFEREYPETFAALRDLLAIIKRLPKTADGVQVVPGMTVWPCADQLDDDERGATVTSHLGFQVRDNRTHNDYPLDVDEVEGSYSTRAAAEEARKANG